MALLSTLPTPHATESFWLSELSPSLKGYRSTEVIPDQADIAVIGSGISGTFAAHELLTTAADQGQKLNVVMFDAREVCSGATGRVTYFHACLVSRGFSSLGCTLSIINHGSTIHQNGGHCQPALYCGDPEISRLEIQNYHYISQVIQNFEIDCDWQPRGAVTAFFTDDDFTRAIENLEKSKVDAPEITGYLRVIFPKSNNPSLRDLGVSKAKGAILNTLAASLWPYKLIARIVEDLLEQRPEFNLQTNTPVKYLEPVTKRNTRSWRLHTSRGNCVVKHVLLATNGYTSHLVPSMKHIIQPVRGNMIAGHGDPELLLENSYGLMDDLTGEEYRDLERTNQRLIVDGEYLMQRPSEHQVNGMDKSPTLVLGGARFMIPNSGYGLSDDSVVDQQANEFLRGRLSQVLSVVAQASDELKVTHEWTGILGYSKDSSPWIGELQDGLWLCAGYNGHGMPQAALCAVRVATMILEQFPAFLRKPESHIQLPIRFLITPERLKSNGLPNLGTARLSSQGVAWRSWQSRLFLLMALGSWVWHQKSSH